MKKHRIYILVLLLILLSILSIVIYSIIKNNGDPKISDPSEYKDYISAFSPTVISKNDEIIVQFTDKFLTNIDKKNLDVLTISPNVKGNTSWENNVLVFKPEKPLLSGKVYYVTVDLKALDDNVPSDKKHFIFSVFTKKQSINVSFSHIKTTEMTNFSKQDIYYKVVLNDGESVENIQKCLKTTKKYPLEITALNDKEFTVVVKNVERSSSENKTFKFDFYGNYIGSKNKGSISTEIPATNIFKIIDFQVEQSPEQYVNIVFSDPIKEEQYLDGLIRISGVDDLKFLILDNCIKIIPSTKQRDEKTLFVSQSVTNINNKKLGNDFSANISFDFQKPELKNNMEGCILTSNNKKQIVSFQAANIKAVDVRITQIYENNILQFLQTNSLNGSDNLNRVGKAIVNKTIDLTETDINDFNKFNTFFIDISEIVKIQQGAIYRIEISFRKENSIFVDEEGKINDNPVVFLPEDNEWNWFDYYTYNSYEVSDYEYDYYEDWDNNNSPSSDSYYGYRRALSFNILASNIGLIVKQGEDHVLNAYVTDILNAKTVSNARVAVYDYQQQLIADGTSDNSEGKVTFKFKKEDSPYFVVASNNKQNAYITLDDFNALYTSKFDVSGEVVQNGTSAYIYGDRGVWRPGDSIFLGFIINEKLSKNPEGTPIKLEVRNPQNQIIYSEVQGKNEKGFHLFKFNTDTKASTGYYYADFKFGGQHFSKSLMVETIKPNRLNILLDFNKKYLTGDGSVIASLKANWLQGNPATNMNFTTNVSFSLLTNPFKGYEDYTFNNNAAIFNYETDVIIKGKTDNDGLYKAPVIYNKLKNAPGVLKASLTTKILENSGNINISEQDIKYFPYKNYIGMKTKDAYSLPINKDVTFNFIALDINNKILTEKTEIEISVYKIESYYWYDISDQKTDYITANYNNALLREKYSFTGKGHYDLKFEEDGSYFFVAKNINTGQIISEQVYASPYYQENNENGLTNNTDSPELINFKSDKEKYNVGETIKIKVPLGTGIALVSIENSTEQLSSFWVKSNVKNEISFTIKAEEKMAPNIFVNIIFLQAHNNTINDLPIRIYGIIPILVEDPNTHLYPIIEVANELQAETEITVKVSEKDGKKMTYTIAMVDEGLLSLTNFKTPNPWNAFFSKKALGVRTWDVYDDVIKAFAIDANRTLSIGGDMAEKLSNANAVQANRFKSMVRFLGPFTLEKGMKKNHKIKLPQYIGAVRTMVVAAGENSYGSAEKTSKVVKPLMILGTAPRKIGINESFKIPVTVFAMKENIKNVSISIKTNDKLNVVGAKNKTINFSKTGEKYIEFDLKANSKTGIGKINITANSNNNVSHYDIEIDVKYLNNKITESICGIKESGKDFTETFNTYGITGTNEAYLEIYSIPPINLEKRLDYLITYPHGCIEQIVSSVFPQLYLENFITLDSAKKKEIQNNIKICISKLAKYQTRDGGFSYWQGCNYANEWGTSYAGHFMIEAEKAGYSIPINLKNNWIKFQKKYSGNWENKGAFSQENQAYRLLTLALSGNADMSAMNRLKNLGITTTAKWNLANAYSIIGKKNIAKEIIFKLDKNIPEYNDYYGSFGSATRDKAMVLGTLINLNDKNNAFLVLKDIATVLGSDSYCSTQTTAYSLMEIARYIKTFGNSEKIDCNYTINGQTYSAKTNKSVFKTKLKINENNNSLTITSNNSDIFYVNIVQKGIPEAGSETTANSYIDMQIKYTNLDGGLIDITNLQQGCDFIATVTIRQNNPAFATLNNVALSQIFPSGWEILNSRMYTTKLGENSLFEYQDIRDDRVLTYLNMVRNRLYTYKVMLTASYCGEFYLPATTCESMYDNNNYAREKGKFIKVTSH